MMTTTFPFIKCMRRNKSHCVIISDDSEDFAEISTSAAQGREGNVSNEMEDVEIYELSSRGYPNLGNFNICFLIFSSMSMHCS